VCGVLSKFRVQGMGSLNFKVPSHKIPIEYKEEKEYTGEVWQDPTLTEWSESILPEWDKLKLCHLIGCSEKTHFSDARAKLHDLI